jgi:endo-1,4-beta-xylanase
MSRLKLFVGKLIGISIFLSILYSLSGLYSCTGKLHQTTDKDTVTSLCKVFEDYFRIGVALSDSGLKDTVNMRLTKKHFNSITDENAMKWEFIHPKPGKYDFDAADRFVEFGEKNGMYIVGHVLVWHSQTPPWVFTDNSGNRVSRDTLLNRMRDHIYTVVGRYKGRVQCWDVINEAIGDNGEVRQNIWYQITGIDYVQKAFEYAREADPNAMLVYNDYSLPTPVKREGVINLIKGLQEKGVKVDAIGEQAHYHLDYPNLNDLEQSIVAFSQLGCKVLITEMDINVLPHPWDYQGADVRLNFQYNENTNPYPDALPDSMQRVLADRYASFFKIFLRHSSTIDRVTLWGIQDGSSWLNHWPVDGRSNYPLLFDRNYNPKPAFWAVVSLVKSENR